MWIFHKGPTISWPLQQLLALRKQHSSMHFIVCPDIMCPDIVCPNIVCPDIVIKPRLVSKTIFLSLQKLRFIILKEKSVECFCIR